MIPNPARYKDSPTYPDCALPQTTAMHKRLGRVEVRAWAGRCNGCAAVRTEQGEDCITREIELVFA